MELLCHISSVKQERSCGDLEMTKILASNDDRERKKCFGNPKGICVRTLLWVLRLKTEGLEMRPSLL